MNERAKLLHSLTIERADAKVSPPRRRLWPVVAATIFGVIVVMVGLVWYFAPEIASLRPVEQAAAVAPASSRPPSATVPAAEATRSGGLVASGYVVARRKATVASEITGKVVEVLVDEGNVVQAGDLLARLDSTLTESDLNLAKSRAVASEAAANAIAADLRDAERILARIQALQQKNFATEADLTKADARVAVLRAQQAQAQAQVQTARLDAKRASEVLAQHHIRAPFAGVVVERSAQPGEMISPISAGGGYTRTGICTIVDMTRSKSRSTSTKPSSAACVRAAPSPQCSTPIRNGPFPPQSSPSFRPPIARRRPSRYASASSRKTRASCPTWASR